MIYQSWPILARGKAAGLPTFARLGVSFLKAATTAQGRYGKFVKVTLRTEHGPRRPRSQHEALRSWC